MLAPIIFFTYKRLESIIKTIDSLKTCSLASESILRIYSDGAKNVEDKHLVEQVREYLHSINGFKEVIVVERENNMGVDFNIIEGIKEASILFEKFIIVEDDLILSSNFLEFMNQALLKYEKSPTIISISGFSFVNNIPNNYNYDVYFTKRSWSWGWATWSSKVKDIDWRVSDFHIIENNKALQYKFNRGGSDLYNMLRKTMQGKIRAWDVRFFYHQFKNNYITVYPTISKTINIGFGDNATNTFGYNRYKTTLDTSNSKIFKFCDHIFQNTTINKQFIQKNSLLNRIKTRLLGSLGVN